MSESPDDPTVRVPPGGPGGTTAGNGATLPGAGRGRDAETGPTGDATERAVPASDD
jgi:hypothetical protein